MAETAEAEDSATSTSRGLARRLGLATATAMVVGQVIGVGIFLTPAGMAASLGSPAWLIAVWLIMGASAVGGAMTFGGLATRYPEAGGIYVYLREAYGPRVGFLYGWVSMLVTDPGLTAFLGVGLANYAVHIVPLSDWGHRAVAVAAIVALAAVNMLGATIGSGVLRALAGLKIGMLVFLVIWGFGSGKGDWSNLEPFWAQRPGAPPLPQALAIGLISAFISLAGWWEVSKLAGEVRDPGRTIPRALLLGLSIVTGLYIAVSVAFLYLVGPSQIASDQGEAAFAAVAGRALFGRAGELTFAVGVVVSAIGSLAAVFMAFPRVYYAMARDGLFFRTFARVDPSRSTPTRAIVLQAVLAIALALALAGSFDRIIAYFMVPTLAFLALAAAGVFVLRRRPPAGTEGALAIPGYPASLLLFLIPVVLVIVLQLLRDWKTATLGFGVVAVGLPISLLVVPLRRPGVVAGHAEFEPTLDVHGQSLNPK
jgi:basic amino acid/polyamine antiporter, APA family